KRSVAVLKFNGIQDETKWRATFPSSQRRARSASPIARSRNSGETGAAAFSPSRPPRPLQSRWLREILLVSRPLLLCEEADAASDKVLTIFSISPTIFLDPSDCDMDNTAPRLGTNQQDAR